MPDRPDMPTPTAPDDATSAPVESGDRAMTHQHLDTDALSAYIDDRLDGAQKATATAHVATCDDCRHELAELRATIALLNGLPQYRLRRSFTLGSEFSHPVRTSRLARLLPLFPALRAAAVACLLLLAGVGAADILTQIGEDSSNSADRSAMPAETGGDTAMDPGSGADADQLPESGNVAVGDGTGGQSVADPSLSESKPITTDDADQSVAPPLESASNTASSAEGAVSAANSDSAADAPAGDAPAEDAPAASAPAGDAADEDAIAQDSEASDESGAGARSAALPPQGSTVQATETAPAPTVAIAPEPTVTTEPAQSPIGRADSTGPDGQVAGSTADSGISNWRLIEYILAAMLVVLVGLAVSLHRLRIRARNIGLIR